MPRPTEGKSHGFTLVEILVAIAIIGVLSTFAMIATARAREKAFEGKAKATAKQIGTAVGLLANDTGKWPNGCPVEAVSNPETYLNGAQAGLGAAPAVGDQGGGCTWQQADIDKWSGPYMQSVSLTDPWGQDYYFDPDYRPYENCVGQSTGAETPAIVSFGPNGVGANAYDCDDIFYVLR